MHRMPPVPAARQARRERRRPVLRRLLHVAARGRKSAVGLRRSQHRPRVGFAVRAGWQWMDGARVIVFGKDRPQSSPLGLLCSRVLVGDGCWEWSGYRNESGYGVVRPGGRRGKLWLAHRLSFTLLVKPIPDELHVLHKCDNPACIRPDHLFLGTNNDNIADRIKKGRPGGAQCWKRKRLGDDHPRVKVSDADVVRMRQRFANGEKTRALADEYGIGVATAWRIATGRDRRSVS